MDEMKRALTRDEVLEIESSFKRHINAGQVKYLKAGHLDVIESERRGVRFVDSCVEDRDCLPHACVSGGPCVCRAVARVF